MATIYKEVAKDCITNWYLMADSSNQNEETISSVVESESFEELENGTDMHWGIGAKNSIEAGAVVIAKYAGLTEEQTKEFITAIELGPEDSPIFGAVRANLEYLSATELYNGLLVGLNNIHNVWIRDNSSDKTFDKKKGQEKLRQYLPFDIIGWKEAKNDLIFFAPLLRKVGIELNEQLLQEFYEARSSEYVDRMEISSKQDLIDKIVSEELDYSPLTEEVAESLKPGIGKLSKESELTVEHLIPELEKSNSSILDTIKPIQY